MLRYRQDSPGILGTADVRMFDVPMCHPFNQGYPINERRVKKRSALPCCCGLASPVVQLPAMMVVSDYGDVGILTLLLGGDNEPSRRSNAMSHLSTLLSRLLKRGGLVNKATLPTLLPPSSLSGKSKRLLTIVYKNQNFLSRGKLIF
jgi:hypothetical protein